MAGALILAGAVLLVAMVAPHAVNLRAVAPRTASAVCMAGLTVRAILALAVAALVIVSLPGTQLFHDVANWCLAIFSHDFEIPGHPLAHALTWVPLIGIAASLAWLAFGLVRALAALREMLERRGLGLGPMGSLVIRADNILVAITALGRPQVVVSDAALKAMDDQELRASFAHEHAHLSRRHRPLLLLASSAAAIARLIPGSARLHRELVFSLERDADQISVRETNDPLALASAICKAATGRPLAPATIGLSGADQVRLRLDYLTGDCAPARRRDEYIARGTAALLLGLAAALVLSAQALAAQLSGASLSSCCF